MVEIEAMKKIHHKDVSFFPIPKLLHEKEAEGENVAPMLSDFLCL